MNIKLSRSTLGLFCFSVLASSPLFGELPNIALCTNDVRIRVKAPVDWETMERTKVLEELKKLDQNDAPNAKVKRAICQRSPIMTEAEIEYDNFVGTFDYSWVSIRLSEKVAVQLGARTYVTVFDPDDAIDVEMFRGRLRAFLGEGLGGVFRLRFIDFIIEMRGTLIEVMVYEKEGWARIRSYEGDATILRPGADAVVVEKGRQVLLRPDGSFIGPTPFRRYADPLVPNLSVDPDAFPTTDQIPMMALPFPCGENFCFGASNFGAHTKPLPRVVE